MTLGYEARAIKGIDLSSTPPIVSFEDTHGRDLSLPCTCPRFSKLATGSDVDQLLETLSWCKVSVIIRDKVIIKFIIELPPDRKSAIRPPTIAPPGGGGRPPSQTGQVNEEPTADSDHPDIHTDWLPDPKKTSYPVETSASFAITAEERQLRERSQELTRRIMESQMMYCDSCGKDVLVRQEIRGQVRRQFYCRSCNAPLATITYTD
jgi:hypothetical protein